MRKLLFMLLIWACPTAQDAWGCGPVKRQKLYTDRLSFLNLVEVLSERCDWEEIELRVVLAWKIWLHQNSIVYGGPFAYPGQIVREAMATMEDFHRFNEKNGSAVLQENQALTIWKPPNQGICKANWDAVVNVNKGQIGVGIIVCDCEGIILACRSSTYFFVVDPTMAQAWVALQVVLFL